MARLLGPAVFLVWLATGYTHAIHSKTRARINSLSLATEDVAGIAWSTASIREELGQDGAAVTFAEQKCMTAEEASVAVTRFSQLLQFRTVSSPSPPNHVVEPGEWARLHRWLPGAYPDVWAAMEVEQVGSADLSFLLKWEGTEDVERTTTTATGSTTRSSSTSSSSDTASQPPSRPPHPAPPSPLPVLFLSHLDVVPVANETRANWTYDPFSGAVEEGYVWGRGAIDDKVGVSALLEAATLLLRAGWRPQRTLYFAFGQDEEVGGEMGAACIAELLARRGVMVDMVYDEGGFIGADGFRPYSSRPIALIGTAEKGFATINALISATGGHSALPPLDGSSAAAVAARLVTSIDRRPPPASLEEPVTSLLAALAPSVPGIRGILFHLAASGLGGGFVKRLVADGLLGRDAPETAALVRNTAAITGLNLGFADNVLPPAAVVRINFRLLPGSNITTLLEYLRKAAGRDLPHITFQLNGGQNVSLATPVTSANNSYFEMLKTALQEVYQLADSSGPVGVAPTLMPGGTDAKHYLPISRGGALRHTPVSLNRAAGDGQRMHGLNERVAVADFGRAVCVMRRLLELAGQLLPAE